jgi:lactam utilization protein B
MTSAPAVDLNADLGEGFGRRGLETAGVRLTPFT